eukprot:2647761-Alexandrium_andersonii.AAC.1
MCDVGRVDGPAEYEMPGRPARSCCGAAARGTVRPRPRASLARPTAGPRLRLRPLRPRRQ